MISILIANYNNSKYLEACLRSVENQIFKDWECVIVDDCSTDNSLSIINEACSSNHRFSLHVNSQNFGVAKSKAKCIELSKYKYFAFLDSDDQLTENALSKIFETINKFPDQALYFTDHIICDQDMNEIEKQIKKQIENNNKYFFNLNGEISHFAIVNRFFYNKTIGINSNLYKAIDQDLYLKLYDVGGVFYLNILAYKYRIHNQGISTNHNALRALYWHYIVIFQTCERRKLDSAKIFEENFVFRTQYRELQNSYLKLNAYSIFSKLRHWFFKQ